MEMSHTACQRFLSRGGTSRASACEWHTVSYSLVNLAVDNNPTILAQIMLGDLLQRQVLASRRDILFNDLASLFDHGEGRGGG